MRKYLKEGQYSFQDNDLLGKGSFGKVYKGFDHSNNRWVAIKSINLELIEMGKEMKTIICTAIPKCNQISVMRKFTKKMEEKACPYLVKHYDCFRTDTNVYIIMELCQKGTLLQYLQKHQLKEDQVKGIVWQITKGLAYLEELSICHRDLKPDNIFISEQFSQGKDQVYYKIGDFGFAAQKHTLTEVLGTYPFMAPQIFKRQDYTSKVDIWSLGAITYQLLFKDLYFFGKNKWEIQDKVKNLPLILSQLQQNKTSQEMQQFLHQCLIKDKIKRLKASELLSLPLFTQQYKVIFEALQHELLLSQLLRSMAEEICEFGEKTNRSTEFIQLYLLKKSLVSMSLISYSLANNQNYLNIPPEMFQYLKSQPKEKSQISERVQKEYILISNGFKRKYQDFSQYILKFDPKEQQTIKNLIRADQIYSDINSNVFKAELNQWIQILTENNKYNELKLKCQKLIEL